MIVKIKILCIICLMITIFSFKKDIYGEFVQPSINKDTLYLLKNNEVARTVYNVWLSDTSWDGRNPILKWVDKRQMKVIKNYYDNTINCKR